MSMSNPEGAAIRGAAAARQAEVLTPQALAFVVSLQREFGHRRQQLLAARAERQAHLDAGEWPSFLAETESIREADWQVAPVPKDLQDRRVEITGPAERKMMINALNSGAKVFMADFEDANAPTWENCIGGQANLIDAVSGTIHLQTDNGRVYSLGQKVATLVVRPRGWHLAEKQLLVDGEPVSASLFDFGLYFYHNAQRLIAKGSAPYFYLPKLEGHSEARLWNDVFLHAQEALDIPRGTVRATVLIETVLAAFEMDEILYELREHAAGLNAGRWDYIFSVIKKFRNHAHFLLPDRGQVTMAVPFMQAYAELLVKTCHRRGAHAIGGMAAFIPSRKDAEVNEVALAKVREDKVREAGAGFDGTWVAHPDLVPVAQAVFDRVLGTDANQIHRKRTDVAVNADHLLNTRIFNGRITEKGVRENISVALQYLESWLRGTGAVAIFNLMEDAATAEISRSQIWQWIRHGARIDTEGPQITPPLVRLLLAEEVTKIRRQWGEENFAASRMEEAIALFEAVALPRESFSEFLTTPAYAYLD
jgi:malate synthase